MNEQNMISVEDLLAIGSGTKVVTLPAASEKAGRPVQVELKAVEPLDLLRAYDLPMDEINALVMAGDSEKMGQVIEEQVRAMDVAGLFRVMDSVVRCGLKSLPATDEVLAALRPDLNFLYMETMSLTNPNGAVAAAARFPEDG